MAIQGAEHLKVLLLRNRSKHTKGLGYWCACWAYQVPAAAEGSIAENPWPSRSNDGYST